MSKVIEQANKIEAAQEELIELRDYLASNSLGPISELRIIISVSEAIVNLQKAIDALDIITGEDVRKGSL